MAPTITIMDDARALLRLATWLSPAFPIGGFAWSGGLEAACAAEAVRDAATLDEWCRTLLDHGSLRADATALAAVHAGADAGATDALVRALAVSPERLDELTEQGAAFAAAAAPWFDEALPVHVLPVAVGEAGRRACIAREATLIVYLNAALTQQVQAAQRLAPIGQRAATALLAGLERTILETAATVSALAPQPPGAFAPLMDHAAMRHIDLASRIFRS